MVALATTVPTTMRQGDTQEWHLLLPEYGYGWGVCVRFVSAAGSFTVEGTDNWVDGEDSRAGWGDWFFSVGMAESEAIAPGRYQWFVIANNDYERKTISQGYATVEPNVSAGSDAELKLDARTHARRMLAAIEAVLEKRASSDQQSYSIGGRSLARTPIPDLIRLRAMYRREVAAEERAERFGSLSPAKVRVRL